MVPRRLPPFPPGQTSRRRMRVGIMGLATISAFKASRLETLDAVTLTRDTRAPQPQPYLLPLHLTTISITPLQPRPHTNRSCISPIHRAHRSSNHHSTIQQATGCTTQLAVLPHQTTYCQRSSRGPSIMNQSTRLGQAITSSALGCARRTASVLRRINCNRRLINCNKRSMS